MNNKTLGNIRGNKHMVHTDFLNINLGSFQGLFKAIMAKFRALFSHINKRFTCFSL